MNAFTQDNNYNEEQVKFGVIVGVSYHRFAKMNLSYHPLLKNGNIEKFQKEGVNDKRTRQRHHLSRCAFRDA